MNTIPDDAIARQNMLMELQRDAESDKKSDEADES